MTLTRQEVVHHTCEEPRCINPEHLTLMTQREHMRLHKTPDNRCSRGHEFSSENTYVRPNGTRQCRTCRRLRDRGEV